MLVRKSSWILIGIMLCASAAVAATSAERSSTTSTSHAAAAQTPQQPDRLQMKREAIDEMARMMLDRLFAESPQAKRLFANSVGYAVFDNFKMALLISGGGGLGVAVERSTLQKTYMKMGTAGIGLGLGGQAYNVVFLFADVETYHKFIDRGWHADATATATLLSKGSAADASFSHGLAVYQLTNKGLMANIDISGTKYWKSRKLNQSRQAPVPASTQAAVATPPRKSGR